MRRAISLAIAVLLIGAGAASAAWNEPVGGASPINVSPTQDGSAPSLASIGGVPHVAWADYDGVNDEVRVARLNAAGTAWERVGEATSPASPINVSPTQDASDPSLTEVGGVPYVAWIENNAGAFQVRVARLNAAGTDWEAVGGASPLNRFANQDARSPSLTAVNGVPHVAWSEDDATNNEIFVARLNAGGTAWQLLGMSLNPDSPINQSSSDDASDPSLAAVGGIPYVVWSEFGVIGQVRVARLNTAGDGWEKVPASATPLNESPAQNASEPSMAVISGVPHVVWREIAGTKSQVRVARLNSAGTAWERVGQLDNPAMPINESPGGSGFEPSLTAVGAIPYVAWIEEDDASVYQVRVARPNAAGTGWEKVAGGPSPINSSPADAADLPSIAAIGGVPYVAWEEQDDDNAEVRVARLEPDFLGQSAEAGHESATLTATWRTYGVDFPIGFEVGATLESATAPTPAPLYADTPTITQQVFGLTPSTAYQYRSFALAGVEPRLLASPSSFTTAATPAPPDTTPPETKITKDPPNKLEKSKAKYKFTSNEPNSTFVCKFDKKKSKPCDAGKLKLKRLDDGKHKFKVYAVDAAGNQDQSPAKDKFKVL